MENKLVESILKILKQEQDSNIQCSKVFKSWILTNTSGSLMIEFSIISNRVIFNVVKLPKRRKGTLSRITNLIIDNNLDIQVVSVTTPEMFRFCEKYEFSLMERDIGFGTFIKRYK